MTVHEHPDVQLVRDGLAAFARGDMSWMDEHLSDDIVWHVGGNSRWACTYTGKAPVVELRCRQAHPTTSPPEVDVHDILGNHGHVVVLGTANATADDGSSAECRYVNVYHITNGQATEVWGMAEN